MKTTAITTLLGLSFAVALIALDLLAQVVANLLAPFGALPALIFFTALITALIRFTK